MDKHEAFRAEVEQRVEALGLDTEAQSSGLQFLKDTAKHKYTYNFSWMGRPIIQCPQDMIAMQELIWRLQPDLIVETGIAHGGSLIFYASILRLTGKGRVLGIDVDIREHNREAIEAHPMSAWIDMIEGSSVDPAIVAEVSSRAAMAETVLVALDSNHTHAHVLQELRAYSPLVTRGSYCVVFDTIIEDMPDDAFPDRPWGVGNNPKTAVHAFLEESSAFEIDRSIPHKLLMTVAPDGYLRRK